MHILLVSATAMELRQTSDWLEGHLPSAKPVASVSLETHVPGPGNIGVASVSTPLQTEFLVTGVGQLQTAYQLLKKIYTHRPEFIIQAGIGGSTDAGHIGKVFGIHSERLHDLGVEEKSGFKSIFDLNLGDPNHFPFHNGSLINPYKRLMSWSSLHFLEGITVNEISTLSSRIKSFKQTTPPIVESMEGAALHYVCLMEKIPFLQIRSISNALGERDKTRWKLSEALLQLNEALIVLIQKLQTIDETLFRI